MIYMKKNTKKNIEKMYKASEVLVMLESINDNLKIAIERMEIYLRLSKNKYDLKIKNNK